MDELEKAMKEYGMGDDDTIKEIIAEVDTDNVSCLEVFGIQISLLQYHELALVYRMEGSTMMNSVL